MWFDDFVTDNVNFYKESWELIYENLWIQLNSNWKVNIWWIDKLFERWYYFLRKVNNFVEEKYIIKKVNYQDHPKDSFFRMTKLEVEKEWYEEKNSIPFISAWTHIQAWWDIIIWDYNKNTINEIDEIIKILDKKDIENKEEIKKLLEEYKKTKDRSKLVDIFSILWSSASINSMLIALNNLINW